MSGQLFCELAELAKVSDKTIRRDLLLLRRVGCPLAQTHGENNLKRWKLCSDRVLPAALRWDEAAALYVGRKLMQPLAGAQLDGAFQSLAVGAELWASSRSACSRVTPSHSETRGSQAVLSDEHRRHGARSNRDEEVR